MLTKINTIKIIRKQFQNHKLQQTWIGKIKIIRLKTTKLQKLISQRQNR